MAHGLLSQRHTGNLLTGQFYVALDSFPHPHKAKVNWAENPPEMTATKGPKIQALLASDAARAGKLPLEQIGTERTSK